MVDLSTLYLSKHFGFGRFCPSSSSMGWSIKSDNYFFFFSSLVSKKTLLRDKPAERQRPTEYTLFIATLENKFRRLIVIVTITFSSAKLSSTINKSISSIYSVRFYFVFFKFLFRWMQDTKLPLSITFGNTSPFYCFCPADNTDDNLFWKENTTDKNESYSIRTWF